MTKDEWQPVAVFAVGNCCFGFHRELFWVHHPPPSAADKQGGEGPQPPAPSFQRSGGKAPPPPTPHLAANLFLDFGLTRSRSSSSSTTSSSSSSITQIYALELVVDCVQNQATAREFLSWSYALWRTCITIAASFSARGKTRATCSAICPAAVFGPQRCTVLRDGLSQPCGQFWVIFATFVATLPM